MITMAIKYIVQEEEKRIIAVLDNTSRDAYNKAMKMCRDLADKCPNIYICPNLNKMKMPNSFHGIAVCEDDDVFDVQTGKDIAKRICLEKYYTSFDKRIGRFVEDLETLGVRIRRIPSKNTDE